MVGIQLLAVVGSALLSFAVLEAIRRDRMKEELWLVWVALGAGMLVASLWKGPWEALAKALGVDYEPALILLVGILVCLALLLHQTVVVSSLLRNSQRLAQTVARLEHDLERLSAAGAAGERAAAP